MTGLLRRLFSRRTAKEKRSSGTEQGVPWYMRQEHKVTPDRLEAAHRRLKETIQSPDPHEPNARR